VAVLALEVTKADTEALAAARVAPAEPRASADASGSSNVCACVGDVAQLVKQLEEQANAVSDVQERVRELQAGLVIHQPHRSHRKHGVQEAAPEAEASGAPEPEPEGWAGGDAARQGPSCQDWSVVAQNLEAQVGCNLAEVRRRMDALQETIDERVLVQLWQVRQQLPETLGRLDQLAGQCQEGLSKAEAHEVRLDLIRASFETQEQRLQALTVRVERSLAADPGSARRICGGCGPAEAALASSEALACRVEQQSRAMDELRVQLRQRCATAALQERSPPRSSSTDDRGSPHELAGIAELAELAVMAGKLGEGIP